MTVMFELDCTPANCSALRPGFRLRPCPTLLRCTRPCPTVHAVNIAWMRVIRRQRASRRVWRLIWAPFRTRGMSRDFYSRCLGLILIHVYCFWVTKSSNIYIYTFICEVLSRIFELLPYPERVYKCNTAIYLFIVSWVALGKVGVWTCVMTHEGGRG